VYPPSVFPAGATKAVIAVLRLDEGESYPSMTATGRTSAAVAAECDFTFDIAPGQPPIRISTRRFAWWSASVVPVRTGRDSPAPVAEILPAAIP